jgi:hypothetical protein
MVKGESSTVKHLATTAVMVLHHLIVLCCTPHLYHSNTLQWWFAFSFHLIHPKVSNWNVGTALMHDTVEPQPLSLDRSVCNLRQEIFVCLLIFLFHLLISLTRYWTLQMSGCHFFIAFRSLQVQNWIQRLTVLTMFLMVICVPLERWLT